MDFFCVDDFSPRWKKMSVYVPAPLPQQSNDGNDGNDGNGGNGGNDGNDGNDGSPLRAMEDAARSHHQMTDEQAANVIN